MNKKITIINQDSGYLMIDIANTYAKAGYEVSIIAGRLVERNIPLDPSIKLDNICRYRRSSMLMRMTSWFRGLFQILIKVWFRYKNSHLLIISNPPFAPLIPLVCKNPYSLLIYDVYIEDPANFQIIGKITFLVNAWKKAHKKVLAKAEKIFTLTEGMKNTLEKYSGGNPVNIIPIWTDNEFIIPIPADQNPFIARHHLAGKFIVLYSGNIGVDSGVEALIDVAALVKSDKIHFVVIGEGARKETIIKKIENLNLKNCLVLPWQDTKDLPFSLASANLAVVSLTTQASKNSIPSKVYNYMSVGAPILCMADPDSDLAQLVNSKSLGHCFNPSLLKEITDYIINLSKNQKECERLSKNSLQASKEYTVENARRLLV